MKRSKMLILLALTVSCVVLFTTSTMGAVEDGTWAISASYTGGKSARSVGSIPQEDVIELTVVPNIHGYYEIGKAPIVYLDEELKTPVEAQNATMLQGQAVRYDVAIDSAVSSVYVKPPVTYVENSIQPITLNVLDNGAVAQIDGQPWLEVESTEIVDYKDGKAISIILKGVGSHDYIPRNPHIVIDGVKLGGFSYMNFDSDLNITQCMLAFPMSEDMENSQDCKLLFETVLAKNESQVQQIQVR